MSKTGPTIVGVTEANLRDFVVGVCFAVVHGRLKPEKLVVALLATHITKSILVDAILDAAWYVPRQQQQQQQPESWW